MRKHANRFAKLDLRVAQARGRAASPKLLASNTALVSAQPSQSFPMARREGELWGRLVESAVGGHLYNTRPPGTDIPYWRERNREVDFAIRHGTKVVAVEIKSGRNKGVLAGLNSLVSSFPGATGPAVGTGGIPLETFPSAPAARRIR